MHEMNQMTRLGLPFGALTKALYANQETKDRCVSAFSDRYKVSPHKVNYNVERQNDGRDYIDVSLSLPQNTVLHVPQDSGEDTSLRNAPTTFEVFKSYRMTKEQIENLCKTAGFEIDDWLEDNEGMHLAPALYKP